MAGISSTAANILQNKFQFLDREKQSGEFTDGTGLEAYDLNARFYDPQIGRFHQIDPLTEYMRRWTPYQYAFNNPLRFVDPSGMSPTDTVPQNQPAMFGGSVVETDPSDETGTTLAPVFVTAKVKKSVTVTKDNDDGFWQGVGRFLWGAVDYIPFAGSIKEIGVGIYNGDWKQIGMGVVMLGVDVFTAGEGGQVLRVGKKVGQELVEQEVKEIAEREFLELIEKKGIKNFDEARIEAFEKAGIKDGEFDMVKATEKADPTTGTLTEFTGKDGAKVGYDTPHESPGLHRDTQHISWQSAGKRPRGAQRSNIPYSGPRHPSRPKR